MEGVEICRVARKTLDANISPISVLKSLHRFLKYASSLPGNEEKMGCGSGESESWSLFETALTAGQVEEGRFRAVSRDFFAAAVILCLKLKIGVLIQSCCNNGPRKGLALWYRLGEKV